MSALSKTVRARDVFVDVGTMWRYVWCRSQRPTTTLQRRIALGLETILPIASPAAHTTSLLVLDSRGVCRVKHLRRTVHYLESQCPALFCVLGQNYNTHNPILPTSSLHFNRQLLLPPTESNHYPE